MNGLKNLDFSNADAACHSLRVMAELVRRGDWRLEQATVADNKTDGVITIKVKCDG